MLGKSHTSQSLGLHFHQDSEKMGGAREEDDTHAFSRAAMTKCPDWGLVPQKHIYLIVAC